MSRTLPVLSALLLLACASTSAPATSIAKPKTSTKRVAKRKPTPKPVVKPRPVVNPKPRPTPVVKPKPPVKPNPTPVPPPPGPNSHNRLSKGECHALMDHMIHLALDQRRQTGTLGPKQIEQMEKVMHKMRGKMMQMCQTGLYFTRKRFDCWMNSMRMQDLSRCK